MEVDLTKIAETQEEMNERSKSTEARLAAMEKQMKRSRGAAKVGERVASGQFRGKSAGELLTAVNLVRAGKLSIAGLERNQGDGSVTATDKNGERLFETIGELVNEEFGSENDGARTITAADVTAVADEAVDAELWERAKEQGQIFTMLRSPNVEVAQGSKVALEGERRYLLPTADGSDYPQVDQNPTSTVRNLTQVSLRTVLTPAGIFDADIDLVATKVDGLISDSIDTFDNIVMNADNASTGNVNSDTYTIPNNTTIHDLLAVRLGDELCWTSC